MAEDRRAAGVPTSGREASGQVTPRYSRDVVFNPDGLPVWSDRHQIENDIAAHDHDFNEISLVTRGSATHLSRDGDHQLRPGSVVLVPPNEWHGYAQCRDLVVFDCFVAPELIDGTLAFLDRELPLFRMINGQDLPMLSVLHVHLDQLAVSRSMAALHAIAEVSAGTRRLTHVVGQLLIYLDILDHAWQEGHEETRELRTAPHPVAARALELLENDLSQQWTLQELADQINADRSHLVRVFRQSFGVPPITYLARRRAQVASVLLVRSEQAVAEIGTQVGWHDAAYFSRRFRSFFGLSPTKYRERATSGTVQPHETTIDAPLPVSGARFATKRPTKN